VSNALVLTADATIGLAVASVVSTLVSLRIAIESSRTTRLAEQTLSCATARNVLHEAGLTVAFEIDIVQASLSQERLIILKNSGVSLVVHSIRLCTRSDTDGQCLDRESPSPVTTPTECEISGKVPRHLFTGEHLRCAYPGSKQMALPTVASLDIDYSFGLNSPKRCRSVEVKLDPHAAPNETTRANELAKVS